MKHIACLMLSLLLTACSACLAEDTDNLLADLDALTAGSELTYTVRTVDFYIGSEENATGLELYFFNDNTDLPFIEAQEMIAVYRALCLDYYGEASFGLEADVRDGSLTLTRESDYRMTIDYLSGAVSFVDLDAFFHAPGENALLDLVSSTGFSEAGEPELFERVNTESFDRYGREITLDLSAYHIPTFAMNDGLFMPLQTFSDLMIIPKCSCGILYNGKDAFLACHSHLYNFDEDVQTPLGELYYGREPAKRSPALAQFSYTELCFALDTLYGLQGIHDITSFDQLFDEIGYREILMDTDPVTADVALMNFIEIYLDDLHSAFRLYSWGSGYNPDTEAYIKAEGAAAEKSFRDMKEYEDARAARYPDGCPAYEEVGNTAFVTFDEFNANGYDYYGEEAHDPAKDTFELLIYSHAQITRPGSPIKHVVLDLSNNGGGAVDAAAYVICWYLGEAGISIKNMFTGAMSTSRYHADINLDRQFDSSDTVTDKKLYCLISPNSFSCGNMVPAAFHASHKVTLIGKTSGGGSCVVQPLTTAAGALFQISGQKRVSITKNGSFYDVDTGVEPDVYLRDVETFYDRRALADMINAMR